MMLVEMGRYMFLLELNPIFLLLHPWNLWRRYYLRFVGTGQKLDIRGEIQSKYHYGLPTCLDIGLLINPIL